jgi:biopolymer transport protein TolR
MGIPLQTSASQSRTPTSLAEINVTPFVDVMLVLLIIFMISAPLMQQGVQVDLPKANTGSMDETPSQIMLVVSKDESISINGTTLKRGTLRARLDAIAAAKPDSQVFVQADRNIAYGFIARVIADVKSAGLSRVGLVTEPSTKDSSL